MSQYIELPGIGRVEVEQIPENIPSHVVVGDKKVKIKKELYLWLWCNAYATQEGHKRLRALV